MSLLLLLLLFLLTRRQASPAPTLDLGPDFTIQIGGAGTATGVINYTTNLVIATRTWLVASGPPGHTASFANTGPLQGSVTVNMAGPYTIRLTIRDAEGVEATDTVSLTVSPAPPDSVPPVLTLGPNPTATIQGGIATAELTYTVTGNPTHTISWTSPPKVTIALVAPGRLRLTSAIAGIYPVLVTATNSAGINSKSATFTVVAVPLPTVNLGPDIARQFVGGVGSIQLTYTWTPPGATLGPRHWTVIGGNPANIQVLDGPPGQATVNFLAPGVYEVELEVPIA